jgi:hypothetical protein
MAPASCSTEIAHPRSGGSRLAVHSSSALRSLVGGTNLCGRSFRLLTQGWDSELSDKDLRPPGFGVACVVESGSFSAVASELGTGQPAVSKQVAALEEHLGAQLLMRISRSLSLTNRSTATSASRPPGGL